MKIPLKNKKTGELVAEVRFSGNSAFTSTGKIEKVNSGDLQDVKILRDAIVKYKTFSTVQTYVPGLGHVAFWRGFWGWINGLRLILPSIGYEMIAADIEWPK